MFTAKKHDSGYRVDFWKNKVIFKVKINMLEEYLNGNKG